MRRLVLVFLALIAFLLPALAQAKHPFTFEDMMKLKRVGEPVVSPDGKWVIFSVVDVDLEANTKTPHIWIVPTAGGQEREIIADQDADRPRWAPDGKRFAFISTKEGGSQVWIAGFDGSSGTITGVMPLTNFPTEADGELWSPDGKTIVFTSNVYPECDGPPREEAICNHDKMLKVRDSKVKALIFDRLLYRHWNAYKEGKRSHIFAVSILEDAFPPTKAFPIDQTIPRDLTPGDYDAPVFSLGGQDDYAFSPDGQEICYTSNHDKNEAASTNNDLWIVPVNFPPDAKPADVLAKTKNITADNPASDSTPLYSPDGRYIAYRAQQRPGYESDRFRLMLYDRKTGEKKNITENFDHWVGSFGWAGRHEVILTAEDEGQSPIYSVMPEMCPNGCYPIKILDGFNDDIAAGENTEAQTKATNLSERLVFSRMSLQAPTELFTVEHGDYAVGLDKINAMLRGESKEPLRKDAMAKPRQLTHFNDALLSQVAMSTLESFWFTGAHGDKVQGFLVKPPNFDPSKKYPVKFLIHGGPQGAWGDDWSYRWNAELFAAPTSGSSNSTASSGYVVIMINFHGSTGYGQKFIDAINGDWGGAPFEDLMKGLDYAEEHYAFIDKTRECALGASYGGYMANWVLGHTDRFKSSCRTTACSTPNPPGARPKNSGSTTGSSKALPTTTAPCTRSGRRTCTPRISRRPRS
jgi:dipeptidyl aminopeptidase/acylaminoacyl peptidase